MPRQHLYFVYILASRSHTLYVGVTNDLLFRIRQHRAGTADSFTEKYRIHRLVYYERWDDIRLAIPREKYLKHFTRAEKIALIQAKNPTWKDLAAEFLPPYPSSSA